LLQRRGWRKWRRSRSNFGRFGRGDLGPFLGLCQCGSGPEYGKGDAQGMYNRHNAGTEGQGHTIACKAFTRPKSTWIIGFNRASWWIVRKLSSRDQHIDLAQLRNDLLRRMALHTHCNPPSALTSHPSGWTTSVGKDQAQTPEAGHVRLRQPRPPVVAPRSCCVLHQTRPRAIQRGRSGRGGFQLRR
jgi:hypothetical protein